MADGYKRGTLSPAGKQAARSAARERQQRSFRSNAGATLEMTGEAWAYLTQICSLAWRAGGTVTLGQTQRRDALSLRIWRADEPILQDYLTNEDDWDDYVAWLKDELGVE